MKIEHVKKLTRKEVHRKTQHTARDRKTAERRSEPYRFVGIDTEGVGEGTGHQPVLVSCGDSILHKDGEPLAWKDVFSFLYEHFQETFYVYGGFYLSYDFTQWLKSLPEDTAKLLLTREGRESRRRRYRRSGDIIKGAPPSPVELDGWEFDLLTMTRLRIRPVGESRWMYICDGGPFWQSSFLTAINPARWVEPICTPEEYALVEQGKKDRSAAIFGPKMVEYQQLEVEIWARLMTVLDTGLRDLGIRLEPKQWMGPGQVAQEWLKQQDIPRAEDLPDLISRDFYEAAEATYFGGWFEIFMHGHIPGITYEYDINSAYPYVIAQLPCLRHGRFRHGIGQPQPNKGDLCIVRGIARGRNKGIGWSSSDARTHPIGAMLHRDKDHRIYRPHTTEGTWWLHELEAAERAGLVNHVDYKEWWIFEQTCDCPPPLSHVKELYYKRLEVGKNTALGKAIRLLINSVYGKFAQSVGEPMFGNAIYASLITAGCRTMILDAIATHPIGQTSVAMIATDGVYFIDPHPGLVQSDKLGDWELKEHQNMTLFKPGMYWDDKNRERIRKGEAPEFKSRGINADDFKECIAEVDRVFSSWPKLNKDGSVAATTENTGFGKPKPLKNGKIKGGQAWPYVSFLSHFSMVSMTQAVQPGWDWRQAGRVDKDKVLQQTAWPGEKRDLIWYDPERDVYRSFPRDFWMNDNGPWRISEPYDKTFGMDENSPWSVENIEDMGITPDGTIYELVENILRSED